MLNPYHDNIDKTIIQILYKNEKLASRKLKDELDDSLKKNGYNETVADTYWGRLRRLTAVVESSLSSNINQQKKQQYHSKYTIQPVLVRHEEIRDGNLRGANVYYSLAKHARIRSDLKLPILRSEESIEKAYRLLLHYAVFESSPPLTNYNNNKKRMMDENEYNNFLEKLYLSEKDLELDGKPGYNRNLYKVTIWLHPQSEIKFIRVDYLEGSDKYGKYEYDYKLPGLSINEFSFGIRSGLVYEHLKFTKDDITQYFKLLENKILIQKLQSLQLEILNEERYTIVDNSLKNFLKQCWLLHGSVTLYLYQKWKCIQGPTDEERIWYEHLWGQKESDQIINSCYENRTRFNKSKNVKSEKGDIQKLLKSILIGLQRTFKSIKNTYSDIIEGYSYLANPLLNLVYPQFFRN